MAGERPLGISSHCSKAIETSPLSQPKRWLCKQVTPRQPANRVPEGGLSNVGRGERPPCAGPPCEGVYHVAMECILWMKLQMMTL